MENYNKKDLKLIDKYFDIRKFTFDENAEDYRIFLAIRDNQHCRFCGCNFKNIIGPYFRIYKSGKKTE